jgi:restriction system protein
LGRHAAYFQEYYEKNIIGIGFIPKHDLSNLGYEDWVSFRTRTKQLFTDNLENKTPVSIGLSQGVVYGFVHEMKTGDIVIVQNGNRTYFVGEITSNYIYEPRMELPHTRQVKWLGSFPRDDMSDALKNSTGSLNCLVRLGAYGDELESIFSANKIRTLAARQNDVPDDEDSCRFSLERHLEDFIVANWNQIEISKNYDIYSDENGTGQQYQTDTGRIDILAISKDAKTWLVIELKRDQANDDTVGQVLRYMGYVKDELADKNQDVKGLIIGRTNDSKGLRRALSMLGNVDFYTYEMSFNIKKVD